jgi:WD40 repeat protein
MGISNWTIWSVAFSPNGQTMVTAGDDGRVKVWTWNGSVLSETGHVLTTSGATFVAFSPNGSQLAVGSRNGSVVYNTSNWTVSATLTGILGSVYDIGFSPDGQQVISIDGTNIYVHAVGSPGSPIVEALSNGPYALAVSPVATPTTLWAAVAFTDGTGGVLNVRNSVLSSPTFIAITSNASFATAARFSPDGTLLAAGGEDGVLKFWSIPLSSTTPVGNPIMFSMGTTANGVNSVAFSPSGAFLAVAAGAYNAGGSASIWNMPARTLRGSVTPTYYPVSVAFSPNGGALAIGEVTCGLVMICAD